jgi:hypothetical protein
MINRFNLKMDLISKPPHGPSNAIERGGSGDTYPTYWTRLESILRTFRGHSN